MATNLETYKKDLQDLIVQGKQLSYALRMDCDEVAFVENAIKQLGEEKGAKFISELPSFQADFQSWYSEAKTLIKQLLPDRLDDFVRHYEKPKPRKDIDYENYRIEDALQNLVISGNRGKVADPAAAIPHIDQQVAILKSANARFESSLFDIKLLVQADLFDSELDAASELLRNKFIRAAGVVAGVVLEKHLIQVCANHNIKITKKDPVISDTIGYLKENKVIDIPRWRLIQSLADIRNLCGHGKEVDPTKEQVQELIEGVAKTVKTLF